MEQFLSICSQRKLPACPQLAQWAPSPGQEARGCGRRQEWRKAGFPQPSWDAGPCRQAGQAHPAAVCPRDRRRGLDGQDSGSLRDGQPAWRELGGWASGGWRRGTACGARDRERCRRGRRGQLGTEAEGFILPREVRARPGCKACVHPMPFQRRQPPVPGSPQPGTAAGVTGSGGRPAAASPGLLRADAHQMPSACCPELLHQRRKAPPSLVTGGLSYGPVPLSGHAHSQSGPTDPQAHHPQGL